MCHYKNVLHRKYQIPIYFSFEVDLVVSKTVTIEPSTKNDILVDCDHPNVKSLKTKLILYNQSCQIGGIC